MVALQPLSEVEYPDFFELAVSGYARDNAAGGRWLEAEAPALARKETESLLPNGVATPGHYLFSVRTDGEAAAVGYLWFASMLRGTNKMAYVYQVIVKPEYRRRGYGRAALAAAERKAVADGHAGMALHVFAHNDGARALYESVGYRVSGLNLFKVLAPSDV